jgi:CxxC motif-containing protein
MIFKNRQKKEGESLKIKEPNINPQVNQAQWSCSRGHAYVRAELTDPKRMVATTVKIRGGIHPLMPVYTESPFPKPKIFDLLEQIKDVEIQAPIEMGQVIIENVLGTGINIIANRDMPTK